LRVRVLHLGRAARAADGRAHPLHRLQGPHDEAARRAARGRGREDQGVSVAFDVGWAKRSVPTDPVEQPNVFACARRLRAFAHPTVLALALATQPSCAADLQVYSSGAPAQVVQAAAVTFSQQTGDRVSVAVAIVAEIERRLAAAPAPDVVILPAPVIGA